MKTDTKQEIQVCGQCGGTGYKLHEELSDYHKHEYTYHYTTCNACEGSGLQILITTITKTIKAHKPKVAKDGKLL